MLRLPGRRLGALTESRRRTAAVRERLRSHLGAGGGQGADRLAVLWRPLAQRLVSEVLPRPRAVIGDQALYCTLGGRWERVERLLACPADTGWRCSRSDASSISASKSSWRQLGRCRPPLAATALWRSPAAAESKRAHS